MYLGEARSIEMNLYKFTLTRGCLSLIMPTGAKRTCSECCLDYMCAHFLMFISAVYLLLNFLTQSMPRDGLGWG